MCIEKNIHSACGFDTPIRIRYGWHALICDKWAHFQSLYILSLVNTCRSSHLDRTKKGHVGPNHALYFGPARPLPVAHFGLAGPKLDADRNSLKRSLLLTLAL